MATNGLDRTTLKAYGAFLAAGVAYDHLIKCNLRVGHAPIDGCPAWTWYIGLTMQSVVYPSLYLRAASAAGDVGLLAWFRSSWSERSESSAFWEKLWFASFASYLTRDYPYVLDSPKYIAHHIVCQCGVLFGLWIPRGSVPLLSGMMVLEFGSLGMTCAKILPPTGDHTDPRWDGLYYVLMAVSNVLCLCCCAYNIFVPLGLGRRWVERAGKAFFALLTAVLVYLRQDAAGEYRATAEERYAAVADPLPDDEKWIGDDAAAVAAAALGLTWVFAAARAFWNSYKKEEYIMFRFETVKRDKEL